MAFRDPNKRREYHRQYMRSYLQDPVRQRKHRERVERSNRARMQPLLDLIAAMKSQPCMDCGGTFDPVCMDFDHRPGETKRDNVASLVSNSHNVAVILEEIAKCDIVCANCHRLRTKQRGYVESPREQAEASRQTSLLERFE